MRTVVVSSLKGGVGKTSLAILLGNAFASSGRNVLLIDLDHQMNVTQYHRRNTPNTPNTRNNHIGEALKYNDISAGLLHSWIINTDIIASSFKILEYRFESPELITRLVSQAADRWDVCIIDCHPTLDNIVYGAWRAADVILTPLRLDSFDLEGPRYLREWIKNKTEDGVQRWKTVMNFYRQPKSNEQYSLPLQYEDAFTAGLDNLMSIRIPIANLIFKAVHGEVPITRAKTKAPVFNAIVALASELIGEPVKPERDRF